MSNFLKHIPCLKCGSSDGNSLYDDNHEYCHVCGNHIKGDGTESYVAPTRKKNMLEIKGQVLSISDRGITRDTCQHYGVTQDETTQYYPYADAEGSIVATKNRVVETKSFGISGEWKNTTLFGQQ